MNERQKLGRLGEKFAEQVLCLQGYRILERNYRCRDGEIDLIADKDEELFFIEVKTRRNSWFGQPCEAVDRRKQMNLRKAAQSYVAKNRCYYQYYSFQVVEVDFRLIENAF